MRCLQNLRKAAVTHLCTEDKATAKLLQHTLQIQTICSQLQKPKMSKKEHCSDYHGDLLAQWTEGSLEPRFTPPFHNIAMWANCPLFCLKSSSAHKMTPTGNNYEMKTSAKTRTPLFFWLHSIPKRKHVYDTFKHQEVGQTRANIVKG